eukprot:6172217-Pleurochrysis_carterae.AAC.2
MRLLGPCIDDQRGGIAAVEGASAAAGAQRQHRKAPAKVRAERVYPHAAALSTVSSCVRVREYVSEGALRT